MRFVYATQLEQSHRGRGMKEEGIQSYKTGAPPHWTSASSRAVSDGLSRRPVKAPCQGAVRMPQPGFTPHLWTETTEVVSVYGVSAVIPGRLRGQPLLCYHFNVYYQRPLISPVVQWEYPKVALSKESTSSHHARLERSYRSAEAVLQHVRLHITR